MRVATNKPFGPTPMIAPVGPPARREVKAMGKMPSSEEEYDLIFRPYYTTKDGRRVYAKWYGRKAWPLWVPRKK